MWKYKKSISIIAFVFAMIVCISIYVGSADNDVKKVETAQSDSNVTLYSDVKANDWFYNHVKYVSEKGIMNGTANNMFSPYEKTTRGMIVTILWRLDGALKETGNPFFDVSKDAYYYDAVAWASNHQIVDGYDDNTTFGADDAATREQMILIIYRYAAYKNYDVAQKSSLDAYIDKAKISDYAVGAIEWGNANGIISGVSDDMLAPQDFVQRCQIAAILQRFCVKYVDVTASEKENNHPKADATIENEVSPTDNTSAKGNGGGTGGGSSSNSSAKATSVPVDTVAPSDKDNEAETNHTPTLTVNSAEVKPGENVKVNVSLVNNPGILGMTLIAYYDETYCTLQNVESGDAFADVLTLTTSNTLNSGVKFMWDGIDLNDEQIKDGTVVTMNFCISDNAPEGNIPITLKCYDGDAVDRELKNIPLQITSGNITVKSN